MRSARYEAGMITADNKTWGSSFLGTGGPPPPPEKHPGGLAPMSASAANDHISASVASMTCTSPHIPGTSLVPDRPEDRRHFVSLQQLFDPAGVDGVLSNPDGPVKAAAALRGPHFRIAAVMTDKAAIAAHARSKPRFVLCNGDGIAKVDNLIVRSHAATLRFWLSVPARPVPREGLNVFNSFAIERSFTAFNKAK
jgi:hypothetical protein